MMSYTSITLTQAHTYSDLSSTDMPRPEHFKHQKPQPALEDNSLNSKENTFFFFPFQQIGKLRFRKNEYLAQGLKTS